MRKWEKLQKYSYGLEKGKGFTVPSFANSKSFDKVQIFKL